MRLYLSSFRLGNQPRRLVGLVGANARAAVVLNACDFMAEGERATRARQEITALQSLGFRPEELDLRHYFNDAVRQRELGARLSACGLVWVRGGNSFILRRAMAASRFDRIIGDLLAHDALAYGGFSAAVAVLTPSLRGVELIDDPQAVPPGYDHAVIWEGLGLLPYAVAPHYRSDHPESADVEKLVQYYIDHHVPFRALRDGEIILVTGQHQEVLG